MKILKNLILSAFILLLFSSITFGQLGRFGVGGSLAVTETATNYTVTKDTITLAGYVVMTTVEFTTATATTLTVTGDITMGELGSSEITPTFSIIADADSDPEDTDETFSITLVQNADPTLAPWRASTTQSVAGFDFDMPLTASTFTSDGDVSGTTGTFTSTITDGTYSSDGSGNFSGAGTFSATGKMTLTVPVGNGGVQLEVIDGTTGGSFSISDGIGGASSYIPIFTGTSANEDGFGLSVNGTIPVAKDALFSSPHIAAGVVLVGQRVGGANLVTAHILAVRNNLDTRMIIEADGDVILMKQNDDAITDGTSIALIQGFGNDDTASADEPAGQIEIIATGTWTDNNEVAKMVLNVVNNGTLNANQLAINADGSVSFSGLVIRSVTAGITATNPGAQGDSPLTTDINEISTVGAGSDAVTLPAAVAGLEIFIINNGANILEIFPASSDNLGAGVDTATTLAAGANIAFVAYDGTNWEVK